MTIMIFKVISVSKTYLEFSVAIINVIGRMHALGMRMKIMRSGQTTCQYAN